MSTKVVRSKIAHFLDVMPTGTTNYQQIGDGVTSALINMNPKTTEETYIHQDTASFSVDSYAPTLPIKMTAVEGDNVFEFVDGLLKTRAVGTNAQTTLVNVWKYEALISGSMYPAEQQSVVIAVESKGGDGGKNAELNFTINYVGDATKGFFHVASGTFLSGNPAN